MLHPYSDLFGKQGREFLEQLELPRRRGRWRVPRTAGRDRRQIKAIEEWMEESLQVDEIVRLLRTIPGIGLILRM